MSLVYPGLLGKPILIVSVEDLLSGNRFLDIGCGLLGMDIVKRWKSVCIENGVKGMQIRIGL